MYAKVTLTSGAYDAPHPVAQKRTRSWPPPAQGSRHSPSTHELKPHMRQDTSLCTTPPRKRCQHLSGNAPTSWRNLCFGKRPGYKRRKAPTRYQAHGSSACSRRPAGPLEEENVTCSCRPTQSGARCAGRAGIDGVGAEKGGRSTT